MSSNTPAYDLDSKTYEPPYGLNGLVWENLNTADIGEPLLCLEKLLVVKLASAKLCPVCKAPCNTTLCPTFLSVWRLCASVLIITWLSSVSSSVMPSIPILGLVLLIASLCGEEPDMTSVLSLTTASGFNKPSSSMFKVALIPLSTSLFCNTSFLGLSSPSPNKGSAVWALKTIPVFSIGADKAVSISSLKWVG